MNGPAMRTNAKPQGSFVYMSGKDAMSGKTQFVPDIIIPAGRGARHKARRIALANPNAAVKVVDKRGACHYQARSNALGTIDTVCYYWQRRNAVQHFTTHTHPSAEDIARRQGIKEIREMLDNAALACPVCRNHACLPNWPEIDRCKVEHAHDIAAC